MSLHKPTPPADAQPLYKKREPIYPKLVSGNFRTFKFAFMGLALLVYYGLPWLRWDRGPNAPDQAVLFDFAGGRFYFGPIEIWPQEVYYITGILILASLGLFLVTSLFGRVWCGYACPQTVWTDLYIAVERFFEGDRNKRIKLNRAPWSINKLWRKVAKHAVWLIIAAATGGALVFYFHDAPSLVFSFFTGHADATAYVFVALLTFTTYSLAGTMREQVCTYLCPWPRIQAALTDEHALNVTYRWDRGEPRGPHKKSESWEGRGDCVDCNACVTACPMGIDIRNGAQLECIHCALCIDACDDIMRKVDRPTGLIAYDTDNNVERRAAGLPALKFKLFRPRVIIYAVLIAAISALMVFGLATRSTFELNVLKDRAPAFVQLSDGRIQNGYTVKLVNKQADTRAIHFEVSGIDDAEVLLVGEEDGVMDVEVEGEHVDRFRLIIKIPEENVDGNDRLRIVAIDTETGEQDVNLIPFSSPRRD
ncbi:cytochrome c oxidase accessory protein CcoG [Ponticaulis sp.]|uniref:cytochrome c oxidase accessory protein CcoG n=1 Tax=Ponticaulis sp. TaxID=2020902 RepID=UPI000B6FB852|nr:cytochrome c oxidase accessory protein CcoG [Ponticaulis sp.]MAI89580.1 cytochrome c oxidase accessory protein CcoG [Ponticaulis sp.]OUY00607.1 MAG: cytochrome c oxidase accessory protein CcoG [Hyphomonadaceae bacterium TMED5]|tara:strand:- start:32782 stop:34218 length:1437 start_codon:yes stop_codon:yes gene_type:complete